MSPLASNSYITLALTFSLSRCSSQMRTRRHRTGALCDLGAAYIHGTIGNPLVEVATEAGVSLKQVRAEAVPIRAPPCPFGRVWREILRQCGGVC